MSQLRGTLLLTHISLLFSCHFPSPRFLYVNTLSLALQVWKPDAEEEEQPIFQGKCLQKMLITDNAAH